MDEKQFNSQNICQWI